MKILYNPIFLDHDTGRHPENASRLTALGELESTPFDPGEPFLELVHYTPKIMPCEFLETWPKLPGSGGWSSSRKARSI